MFENKQEHLTVDEHILLGDIIKGQMQVINKLQNHLLIGDTGSSVYIDNCGRIGQLINGLGYLIAFRSGSNIDWAIGKIDKEEEREEGYQSFEA